MRAIPIKTSAEVGLDGSEPPFPPSWSGPRDDDRWNKRIQRYQDENRELVFKNEALAEDVEKARVDKLDIIDLLRQEDMKKKMELQRLGQELRDTTARGIEPEPVHVMGKTAETATGGTQADGSEVRGRPGSRSGCTHARDPILRYWCHRP